MKIAFISDIHGNAIALESVLKDIQKKNIDKIYVLGDLCYRGPDPRRSLDLVRSLNVEVVKGNADEWVVRGVQKGEVPDQALELMNREREWTVSQLQQSDIDYLDGLPAKLHFEVEGVSIHAFHATPVSLFEVITPNEDDQIIKAKLMSSTDSQVYIYGHIHRPYIRYMNGKVIMNIGSVGLPFDGLTKASYGVIEVHKQGFTASIERVNVDIEKVIDRYKEVQYPNAEMMIKIVTNASLE
ncbi:YfcE family phosphodiesterase [Bacillus sp. MUM 13]|uniref:metallophosphoesterase family protein n=1 Tax=Bacillus sp. MUM 13 TaxID=1678001 RepID=UPI0008F55DEC|nr:YfcE family phosphodiesterase [Bacillus sp. MUM 13]OIK12154.1 YfcE family phosphodiesterase [Bacillus sp. MUM 13]